MAMTKASNSSVKPLSGRAQGTDTCLIPQARAGHPRHPRMQVGFVLKEVQMPPGLFLTVVARTACNAAFRAGEPAAPGEIQVDVQPPGRGVEFALRHHPWRLDAQRHPKQVSVTHYSTSSQRGFVTRHH